MTPPAARVASTGLGLLMAAATAGPGPAAVAAAAAVIAVLAGAFHRPAATLAVLLAAAAIALGNAAPLPAALAGLSAAAYLVVRHTALLTAPTLISAVGFTVVGLVAVAFPLRVPWLPVLAPLAAAGCYAVVTRPFLDRGN